MGLTSPHLESDKNISIFWILDHLVLFEKMFFAPRKAEKFSKFAKNKVKTVKVAVLAAPCNVLAAPRGVSVVLHGMLAVPPKSDQNHLF